MKSTLNKVKVVNYTAILHFLFHTLHLSDRKSGDSIATFIKFFIKRLDSVMRLCNLEYSLCKLGSKAIYQCLIGGQLLAVILNPLLDTC